MTRRPDSRLPIGRIRVFTVLALLALTMASAGCGGDSGSENPRQILEDATWEGIESGKIHASLGVNVTGREDRRLDVVASGPFETEGEAGEPELEITASVVGSDGGEDFELEGTLTVLSDRAYVNYEGKDYEVEPGEFSLLWESLEQGQNQDGEGERADLTVCRDVAEGLEVADFIDNLKSEGDADVEGTSTTKVSGDLNAAGAVDAVVQLAEDPACSAQLKAAGRLPIDELEEARDELTAVASEGHIEVYVGDDDIVRRIAAELTIEPEDAQGENVELAFEHTLSEINEDQEVSIPTDVEPIQEVWREYGLNPVELIAPVAAGEGLGDLLEALTEGGLGFLGLSSGSQAGGSP